MKCDSSLSIIKRQFVSYKNLDDDDYEDQQEPITSHYTSNFTDDDISLDILVAFPEAPPQSTQSECPEEPPKTSRAQRHCVKVVSSSGNQLILKIYTLCWLFSSEGTTKLSNDRLVRVREHIRASLGKLKNSDSVCSNISHVFCDVMSFMLMSYRLFLLYIL